MRDELSNRIYSHETRNKISQKIAYLDSNKDAKTFIFIKMLTTMILFFVLLITKNGYLVAPLLTIVYYYLYDYLLLDLPIAHKIKKLEQEALDFFPLLLLNIKGGRSIKQAIKLTTALFDNELSNSFLKVSNSLKYGKSIEESLTELESKMPSPIISNIIVSIKEASITGNNINNSVDKELEYLKEKNKQNILFTAKTKPLKMLFVSFIFSLVMLVLLILLIHYH